MCCDADVVADGDVIQFECSLLLSFFPATCTQTHSNKNKVSYELLSKKSLVFSSSLSKDESIDNTDED